VSHVGPTVAADTARYGRRRCFYGRVPPLMLLRLLLMLLYSQFGD